jgi:hypothetical protein
MVLEIIYWVLIILACAGFWVPAPYQTYWRGFDMVLFIIIGLHLFGVPH